MSNDTRMVTFKSVSNNKVVIHEPAYNIHREFPTYGAIQRIPFSTVEQLLWSNGFKTMLERGYIYIESMEDKIDLGLEEPGTKEPTKYKVLNDAQRITLMKVRGFEDFKKEVDTLPAEQLKGLINFAVDNNCVDVDKVNYLKELTGYDIITMIAKKREFEE